jgi:hypothetical protein
MPEMVRWVISIGREATMKTIRSTMDILFGYFTHDLCRYRHRVCHRKDEKCVRRNLSHSHRVSRTVVPDIRDERIFLRAKVRRSEGGLLRFVERLGQPDHVLHRKRDTNAERQYVRHEIEFPTNNWELVPNLLEGTVVKDEVNRIIFLQLIQTNILK